MGTTGAHRRPGKFRLLWVRVIRMFSKEHGEFRLFAIIDQIELSCREQYTKILGLIQGQEELRQQIRERDGRILAADLEILDLKRALEATGIRIQELESPAPDYIPREIVHQVFELPEYTELVDEQTPELDEQTLQDILIADITRAIVPVQTRGVLQIVPLGQAPLVRTSPNQLDEDSSGASV